jgi:L-cysteine:1D-myo-inositol 2-amino-2-deoxy-alpha-D-glucopyranoside ligase
MEVAETSFVIEEILRALANDLDTVSVLAVLERWCTRTENGESGGSAGELSRALDSLLGLAL